MRLTGSQEAFLWNDATFSAISGGFGSGKSFVGILKGLILSAQFPGNEGIVGRFRSTDLEDSTKKLFFEVCPPSWIPKRGGYNKQTNTVTLTNGSRVYFRHIHDPNARTAKTRRVGANLGWFFLDQMEELDLAHWNAMVGRLRNPKAAKRFGFGALNPNGHDWIQKTFFPDARNLEPKELFRVQRKGNILGVMVNSEENRKSNGGFVDDEYFDNLHAVYPPEWIQRYVYGSFDDFSGKIYRDFNLDSVHNITPFAIPKHWQLIVSIDVGGDSPWAVVPNYIDEWGNMIVADGFSRAGVLVSEVAGWIKKNLPWNESRTTFIIDPENKVALMELAEYGIICRPARKTLLPSLLKAASYFHINKNLPLPPWYIDTQPIDRVNRFRGKGSPRTFVFTTNETYRQEHDAYVWHPNKQNHPKDETPMTSDGTPAVRFDTCDADRYAKFTRPQPSELPAPPDKYGTLRSKDPMSAREAELLDRRIAERQAAQRGQLLREATLDEIDEFGSNNVRFRDYDWA